MWPLRSLLYVPAHRRDWVAKAIRVSPDAVILDVEDSVPPQHKPAARALLREEISELKAAGVFAFVRINAIGEGAELDVAAAVTDGLAGVKLPKAGKPEQIQLLHDWLSYHEGRAGLEHGSVSIMPIPETAEGLYRGHELAKASSRVKALCGVISGPVGGDVAQAFGFRPSMGGLEQLFLNSKTVLDSRSAGAMYPVAGVFGMKMDDMGEVESVIQRARDVGYAGVCVMHPSHVAVANRVLRPSAEEIEYFRGMLDAFAEAERAGLGAVSYRGAMIDYAMLPRARDVVAEAERMRAKA